MTIDLASVDTGNAMRDDHQRSADHSEVESCRPERTEGKPTKDNLRREAGVGLATMNWATTTLAAWGSRANATPAGPHQRHHNDELAHVRGKPRFPHHPGRRA